MQYSTSKEINQALKIKKTTFLKKPSFFSHSLLIYIFRKEQAPSLQTIYGINPHAAGVFHIAKQYFTPEGYFTIDAGYFSDIPTSLE